MINDEKVWRAISKASFAVISYVTPSGEPRSTGVVYATAGRRLYLAVAPDSWKAQHITLNGNVSVTVPVRRGGLLPLLFPIPPATISFHGSAQAHAPGWFEPSPVRQELLQVLPPERRDAACIIEVIPKGAFVTYGIGVSLADMRHPESARARVLVA